MDRGFLFGDAVYEVIPVFGGHPLRLAHHLRRLDYSLSAVRIPPPLTAAEMTQLCERLIADHGGGDQILYLQVTRGVAAARDHQFGSDLRPTLFAMSRPASPPSAAPPAAIAAVVAEDICWHRCDIKTTALLGGVMLIQQALAAGAAEALLVRDGRVWEGPAAMCSACSTAFCGLHRWGRGCWQASPAIWCWSWRGRIGCPVARRR